MSVAEPLPRGVTRTDSVRSAVCDELEAMRRLLDSNVPLGSVSLIVQFDRGGRVRGVVFRTETQRECLTRGNGAA